MSFNAGGSSQKSNSQSQSYTDPDVKNALFDNLGSSVQLANAPFKAYSGPGLNLQTGYAAPQVSATPLTGVDLSGYMNPYTDSVVNASMADIGRQGQIADQQAKSQATTAGAWGGDGASVLRSLTADDYARAAAQSSAQLRQQGFQNAQGAAQQDIGNQLSAAFANQNASLQGAGLNSANAQANYGANWQTYLNAQQYPFLQQQMRDQAYGLLPGSPLQTSTSTGTGSGFNFGMSAMPSSGGSK